MILSFYNSGVRGITVPNVVVGMALAVGGLAQLLAGMWEFACGNTFGATGESPVVIRYAAVQVPPKFWPRQASVHLRRRA